MTDKIKPGIWCWVHNMPAVVVCFNKSRRNWEDRWYWINFLSGEEIVSGCFPENEIVLGQ